MSDQEIIELYWARREEAITESSGKYGRYCHYIARNILYNEEDSEECVNDTWLNAWNSMPPRRPDILKLFLGKITRNLAINLRGRKEAKKRGGGTYQLSLEELADCIPDQQELEDLPDQLALADCLNRFLAGENPESRNLFVRRYWYMCSIKEIAESYGMSESKVKMSLLRARERLRQALAREGIQA